MIDRTKKRLSIRSRRGNMLALIAAVLVGVLMLIGIFGYNYVTMLGSHQRQNTAIEAAALAAANDISRIVVDTNEFGYCSLSDGAPVGSYTTVSPYNSGDNWDAPVHSLNTLIGTTRLECVMADVVGQAESTSSDTVMIELAQQDLKNCQSVVTQVTKAITTAISGPGKSGYDMNGNKVTPYDDAENAYSSNQIKMTGSSTYVPGSLKLSLGCLTQGIATNIPVPTPQSSPYTVASSKQLNGYYLSDIDVPYKTGNGTTLDFVFGAIGSAPRLCDVSKWTNSYPLPNQGNAKYQVPAVIKAQASQLVKNSSNPNGVTIEDLAAAAGASVYDPRPAPGALTFSFPDGCPPEMVNPGSALTQPRIQMTDMLTYWSDAGDYPHPDPPATDTSQLQDLTIPGITPKNNPNHYNAADVIRCGMYDWVRRAGAKANWQSVQKMLSTAFTNDNATKDWITTDATGKTYFDMTTGVSNPASVDWLGGANSIFSSGYKGSRIPAGTIDIYRWNTDGTINYTQKSINPYPYQCVSENQLYGEAAGQPTNGATGGFSGGIPEGAPLVSTVGTITFGPVTLPQILGVPLQPNSTIAVEPFYDIYIRDQVRYPGDNQGGQHAGEPLDDNTVSYIAPVRATRTSLSNAQGEITFDDMRFGGLGASAGDGSSPPGATNEGNGGTGGGGSGSIPLIGQSNDFDLAMSPPAEYQNFSQGPGSTQPPGLRPTYQTNGSAVDIRFRREIFVSSTRAETTTTAGTTVTTYSKVSDVGYFAKELPSMP